MLLGCCHCEGYVPPPSESVSSSASAISVVNSCSVCVAAPRKFSLSYTTPIGVSSYPCCADYKLTTVLHYVGGCVWETIETGVYACTLFGGTKTCLPSVHSNVKPRFSLVITGALTYDIAMVHYMPSGIGTALRQRSLFQKTVSSADCLAAVRIPWLSHGSFTTDTISPPSGSTQTGGQQDLCSTVARSGTTSYIDIAPI